MGFGLCECGKKFRITIAGEDDFLRQGIKPIHVAVSGRNLASVDEGLVVGVSLIDIAKTLCRLDQRQNEVSAGIVRSNRFQRCAVA